jgi:hypothetical protein
LYYVRSFAGTPKGEDMEKTEANILRDPILKRMGFLFGIILATKPISS